MNEEKITFTIETNEPIPVEILCRSLQALESEYSAVTQKASRLLVKEIRKGSFEFDLIAIVGISVLPFVTNVNSLFEFFENFKKTIGSLSGAEPIETERQYSISELKNIRELLQPVILSSSPDGSIKVVSAGQSDLLVAKEEARQIVGNIAKVEVRRLETPDFFIQEIRHSKVLFFWYQTRFDDDQINTGNQGLVESIDSKPKKVIFADDSSETKHQMTTTNSDTNRDWQEIGYIVDLELVVARDRIVAYKILKNYPNDSIVEGEPS